jgi:MFS family permease
MSKLRSNTTFLRLFFGRLVTNAGDSLYYIGAMWLVYDLTGSTFFTGVAGGIIKLASSVQFLYGPLVDRWELRKILVSTQIIQAVVILAIPLAAVTGHLTVWVVLAIMPVLSFINEIVYPAQNAALPQIVTEEQLVRANSLFQTASQGTELAFNAAGGLLLAIVSVTTLFVIDSVTFVIAAVLFFGVTVSAAEEDNSEEETDEDYLTRLRAGFSYLWGSVMVKVLAAAMFYNLGAGAMFAVLPAFADSLGGPSTYGLLMAAIAGGPFVGAVSSSLVEGRPYGLLSGIGFTVSGLLLSTSVAVSGILATVALFFVANIFVGAHNVLFVSLVQSSVEEAYLGRVISVMSSISMAMVPLGNVLGGTVGDLFSPALVLYATAVLLGLFGVYFLVNRQIRTLPSPDKADAATLGLGLSS